MDDNRKQNTSSRGNPSPGPDPSAQKQNGLRDHQDATLRPARRLYTEAVAWEIRAIGVEAFSRSLINGYSQIRWYPWELQRLKDLEYFKDQGPHQRLMGT